MRVDVLTIAHGIRLRQQIEAKLFFIGSICRTIRILWILLKEPYRLSMHVACAKQV